MRYIYILSIKIGKYRFYTPNPVFTFNQINIFLPSPVMVRKIDIGCLDTTQLSSYFIMVGKEKKTYYCVLQSKTFGPMHFA